MTNDKVLTTLTYPIANDPKDNKWPQKSHNTFPIKTLKCNILTNEERLREFPQSLFPCRRQCRTEYIYNFIYKENKYKIRMKMYIQKGLPVCLDCEEIRDQWSWK